jgi:hypothetical protein
MILLQRRFAERGPREGVVDAFFVFTKGGEAVARKLASHHAGAEGSEVWETRKGSTCSEMSSK